MGIIIGILIGGVIGVGIGVVPGFNIGMVMLMSGVIGDPYIGAGVIVGVEASSSLLKNLSYIGGSGGEKRGWEAVYSYMSGKLVGSGVGVGVMLVLGGEVFKFREIGMALAIGISLVVWVLLLKESKDKGLGVVAFIFTCLLAIVISRLGGVREPIIVMTTSLYGIGGIVERVRRKKRRIELSPISEFHTGVKWDGILAGLLSSVIWGLPTGAMCRALEEREDREEDKLSRERVAEGFAASLGMAIFLSIGGARSTVTTNLSGLGEGSIEFGIWESVGIMGASLALSLLLYTIFKYLIPIYVGIHNFIPSVSYLIPLILSIGIIIAFSSWWGIVIIVSGIMLNKLIRLAEAPQEINLAALSILPILSIISS